MTAAVPLHKLTKAECKAAKKAQKLKIAQMKAEQARRLEEIEREGKIHRANTHEDGGTVVPEHALAAGIVQFYIGENKGEVKCHARLKHPLDEYVARKSITWEQHRAGKRIEEDWRLAGLSGYPQIVMERKDIRGQAVTEIRMDAFDRYKEALRDVSGTIGPLLIWLVCCNAEYLAQCGTRYYTQGAKAMPRLEKALEELAKHYFYVDSRKMFVSNDLR